LEIVMSLTFRGAAKRVDDIDLPRIGATIGVGEDEIHAVLDVEAAGSGFDDQGRLKALYEPHKAYALSSGAVRAQLVSRGLAYPKWGQQPYPKDSYPRILAAIAIDEDIALRSTSWGLGQIMGFNAGAAGYPSARAMVEAFVDDEEVHLEAMVRFIVANGLDDELRRRDWKGFARGYNGSGQVDHYAGLLAKAFAKWAKIADTPYPPVPTTGSGVKSPPALQPSVAPSPAIIVAPVILPPPAVPVLPAVAPAAPIPLSWWQRIFGR
jgi:hypothetical protein